MTPLPTPEELDDSDAVVTHRIEASRPLVAPSLFELRTRNAQCRRLLAERDRLRQACRAALDAFVGMPTVHRTPAEGGAMRQEAVNQLRAALQEPTT
jgi:hypothetical protein